MSILGENEIEERIKKAFVEKTNISSTEAAKKVYLLERIIRDIYDVLFGGKKEIVIPWYYAFDNDDVNRFDKTNIIARDAIANEVIAIIKKFEIAENKKIEPRMLAEPDKMDWNYPTRTIYCHYNWDIMNELINQTN